MKLRAIKNASIHALFEVLVSVARCLCPCCARPLGGLVGILAFLLLGTHRRRAVDQLVDRYEQVLGMSSDPPRARRARARRVALGVFRNLGRWAAELCSFVDRPEALARRVKIPAHSRAALDSALDRGGGVVFLTGHLGSWEMTAWAVAAAGYPASAVGRRSYHQGITELVHELRCGAGVDVMYREDPGLPRSLLSALSRGRIVGLLVDPSTDLPSRQIGFLGRPAPTMEAPARIALRHREATVFGWCREGPGGKLVLDVQPVSIPAEATLEQTMGIINGCVERAVMASPDHWIWMHPRWEPRA